MSLSFKVPVCSTIKSSGFNCNIVIAKVSVVSVLSCVTLSSCGWPFSFSVILLTWSSYCHCHHIYWHYHHSVLSIIDIIIIHPVPITMLSLTILVPRGGLPRNRFSIGSLTAALRFYKGWVRKDLNLVMGTGCTYYCHYLHIDIIIISIDIII